MLPLGPTCQSHSGACHVEPQTQTAAIQQAIAEVAECFGGHTSDTILYENGLKHLKEVGDILGSGLSASVLDLGGGVGVNFLILRHLGHTGRLILVERFDEYDESNRMGSRAAALRLLRNADVDVLQMDFWPDCSLPLEESAVDTACCYDVLEHLPGHPLRQLRELYRIVKPGGRVLIGAPNAASLMKRVKLLGGKQPYSSYDEWVQERYYEHFREYLRPEYEDLLIRAGFVDVTSSYSAAVTDSRARNSYYRRKRSPISATALALRSVALIEKLLPSLRHTVYAEGLKPTDARV